MTNSVDRFVHPDYGVRCDDGSSTLDGNMRRETEIVEHEGSLYCCRVPAVECTAHISESYLYTEPTDISNSTNRTQESDGEDDAFDNSDNATTCVVVEDYLFSSFTERTTDIFEPTVVEDYHDDGKYDDGLIWLFLGVASVGLISIAAYATSTSPDAKINTTRRVNVLSFLSELVLATVEIVRNIRADSEAYKRFVAMGPYEYAGRGGLKIVYNRPLFLIMAISSEWLCDAMIFASCIHANLEQKNSPGPAAPAMTSSSANAPGSADPQHKPMTLESAGFADKNGYVFRFLFVVFQAATAAAYVLSNGLDCGEEPVAGVVPFIALVVFGLGACCFLGTICLPCAAAHAAANADIDMSDIPVDLRVLRSILSVFLTEIPGFLISPSLDSFGSVFLILFAYTVLELVLDCDGLSCCFKSCSTLPGQRGGENPTRNVELCENSIGSNRNGETGDCYQEQNNEAKESIDSRAKDHD